MTAPWMDRLPTPEEVEAHAAAHGRRWWSYDHPEDEPTTLGLWAWRAEPGKIPCVGPLRLTDTGDLRMWSEDTGCEWATDDGVPGQWLPLTADGMPVALVTEVERLRADMEHVTAERDALARQVAYLGPRQRAGQRIFNAVCAIDPAFANSVRGGDVDPFHDDTLCETFLHAWVMCMKDRRDAAEPLVPDPPCGLCASGGAVDGSTTTPADGRERTTWRATLRQGTRGPERVVELVAREDYLCAWTCVAPTHPPESHTNGSEDGSRAVLLALCDLLYETDEQLVRLERVP